MFIIRLVLHTFYGSLPFKIPHDGTQDSGIFGIASRSREVMIAVALHKIVIFYFHFWGV